MIPQTNFIIEFYDTDTSEDETIFSMRVPRSDFGILLLHQPNEEVFFKFGKNQLVKFIVDDVKKRKIYHKITDKNLEETIVRIPVRQPDKGGDDYKNIPEWWKDIEIVTA